ncbi:membrane protein of unknown function [endosymbiont DhMRE of Dentiscutata heterogama]|uniref:hypothetical protein n=1 Tax=endosymbiont DhMRE of Dentiscutata heterogama TaxID=1609546 RepID=UPI000629DC3B|nr:hypothetical protein [endosymbiont DhMRE of Dentiscutata heterogama]CFW93089.1 membrane protein of unknown function [endosymbiont DhMRE of Dentiscutata heterogama]
MPHKGKSSFTSLKNKSVSFLRILRNSLRILFLIIFLHWLLWITTYAKAITYQEAINDEKIDRHDKKTDKYNSKGLLGGERKERTVAEIENDVLGQIEKKQEGLKEGDLPRKWEKEKLPDLVKLHEQIEELQKKPNPTAEEKEKLTKKKEEYNSKLNQAKEDTIKNIQTQLAQNKLNITELDDSRNWWQKIVYDPLKSILISPLNWGSKKLGLHNYLFLEIIFKLVIIEIIAIWIYFETAKFWENMEKSRDPHLSVEEREQLNAEMVPLFKYCIFNGCMMALFTFFLSYHPAFFDRTSRWWQHGVSGTEWYIWLIPLYISVMFSIISSEFLRHGRLLNKQELKTCIAKNWITGLFITLVFCIGFPRLIRMNSIGANLFSLSGGLVRFAINTIRAKFLGHRENWPHRASPRILH